MKELKKRFNFLEALQRAADRSNALDVDEPKLTSPAELAEALQEEYDKKMDQEEFDQKKEA